LSEYQGAQNDYERIGREIMPNFQRTHFSFIMLNARLIENPIQAISMLLQNSV